MIVDSKKYSIVQYRMVEYSMVYYSRLEKG